MHPDLDDTRVVARASSRVPSVPDVEDTVVRIPELVEPPEAEHPVLEPADEAGSRLRSTTGTSTTEAAPPTTGTAHPLVHIRGIAVFPLDAPVLIGRRPSRSRIHRGPEPHLVTVPSPSKEISASHVQLRRHGNAIVVTDLKSTNGTIVTLPGAEPRTLLRGESAVVVTGTTVDLGDGIVVDILPAEAP